MPFGSHTCGSNDTLSYMGVPDPQGEGRFGALDPQPCSQTVSPTLPPGEYKRAAAWTAIPPFAELLWSLMQNSET